MFIKERLSRSPALVFDVHDRYAETFLAPGSVVRPTEPVRVLAEPADAQALRGWPFAGTAELVTVQTPAGFIVLFDLVRGLKRPGPPPDPLEVDAVDLFPPADGPPRRVRLQDGSYQVRLQCRGFQVAVISMKVPATGPARVDLLPGAAYAFPPGRRPNGNPGPTLIRGVALSTNGSGIANVNVRVTAPAGIKPCLTDAAGQWVIVLDPEQDLTLPPAVNQADLLFEFPGGAQVPIAGFPFDSGKVTALPLTSLRGEVRGSDGRSVAGAAISVDSFAGTSRSRADGAWAYYLAPALRQAGSQPVTVRAAAPDGRTGSAQVAMTFNVTTRVPPILV